MKTNILPHSPYSGLIARLAIQCICPDTGQEGSFLYSGESHKTKHSRVTPVYDDLAELFPAVAQEWEEIKQGDASMGFRFKGEAKQKLGRWD
jgi:hypothetical protein